MQKLRHTVEFFTDVFEGIGTPVLAGGCVRDTLLERTPKDYDLFLLNTGEYKREWDKESMTQDIAKALTGYDELKSAVEWHRSEPFLVKTIVWNNIEVQVMASPYQTVGTLLDSFDWNVCMFGYDGAVYGKHRLEQIGVGKDLLLNKITYPKSTLRRGFRFSERFLMKFKDDDILELSGTIVKSALDKKRNETLATKAN